MSKPVMSVGIECPIIRENDNLVEIVLDSVLKSGQELNDLDVIGITESVVARSQGNYVTVDQVAQETERIFGQDATVMLYNPIYSRNRFAMILKGIARGAKKLIITMPWKDEVGNEVDHHPFTGLDYKEYYKEIVEAENCECVILKTVFSKDINDPTAFNHWIMVNHEKSPVSGYLDCTLHNRGYSSLSSTTYFHFYPLYTLHEYFKDKCEYGLLGSNKATEEKLKLFPSKVGALEVCEGVKKAIKEKTGKDVIVCVYGDENAQY